MAQMVSVPIRFGWQMAIRGRRQILLPLYLQEDLPGPQVPLAPQAPPDHKDLLEQRGLPELLVHRGPREPPARKDLLGPLDQRVLQEPKVLWVLPEQPVRKAPQGRQGQQEPTGRTVSP